MGHREVGVDMPFRLIFPNAALFWAFSFALAAPHAFYIDSIVDFDTTAFHEHDRFALLDAHMIEYSSDSTPIEVAKEERSPDSMVGWLVAMIGAAVGTIFARLLDF